MDSIKKAYRGSSRGFRAWFRCCSLLAIMTTASAGWAQEAGQKFQISSSLMELYGAGQAERYRDILDPEDAINWQVYRPIQTSGEPPGILVYVSPTRSGAMEGNWTRVLDQHNLVYVAADRSGNKIPVTRRMVLATSAIMAVKQQFEIDEERIYISGFSGGGRVASFLSHQYPTVFSGAIYICGVNFWNEDVVSDMNRVLNNRYVFVSGTRDFNLNETRIVYRKYLNAGAEHSLLEIENSMGHTLPNANTMAAALDFLDRK
jgi:poly(3-hydroxybutyrate) depolymerase